MWSGFPCFSGIAADSYIEETLGVTMRHECNLWKVHYEKRPPEEKKRKKGKESEKKKDYSDEDYEDWYSSAAEEW